MRKTFDVTQDRVDEEAGAREVTMRTVIEDKPGTFEEIAKEKRA